MDRERQRGDPDYYQKGSEGKAVINLRAQYGVQKASNIMEVLTAQEFVSAIKEMADNKKA